MIDFPSSPSVGQIFNSGTGPIYVWDGVAWSLQTPTNNPNWQTIEKRDFNAVSAIDFLNLGAFRRLKLSGYIVFSSNGVALWRTSTNNGVSFDAGASDYAFQALSIDNTSVVGGRVTPASYASLTSGTTSVFDFYLDNFNTQGAGCVGQCLSTCFISNATTIFNRIDSGVRDNVNARNALRIAPTTAITLSGTILVQGMTI